MQPCCHVFVLRRPAARQLPASRPPPKAAEGSSPLSRRCAWRIPGFERHSKPGTRLRQLVAPVLERRRELLGCDGSALVGVKAREQRLQACGAGAPQEVAPRSAFNPPNRGRARGHSSALPPTTLAFAWPLKELPQHWSPSLSRFFNVPESPAAGSPPATPKPSRPPPPTCEPHPPASSSGARLWPTAMSAIFLSLCI
jgi:hypothetical protein